MLDSKTHLNVCQVTLARDLPIIIENITEFKSFHNNLRGDSHSFRMIERNIKESR